MITITTIETSERQQSAHPENPFLDWKAGGMATGGTDKILLVDDDRDFCRVYSDILREDHYHVETAFSVREALTRLEETPG